MTILKQELKVFFHEVISSSCYHPVFSFSNRRFSDCNRTPQTTRTPDHFKNPQHTNYLSLHYTIPKSSVIQLQLYCPKLAMEEYGHFQSRMSSLSQLHVFQNSQQVPFLHTFLAHSSMIFWVNGYDKQILAYRVKKDNPCEHKIFHNKFQSQNSVQQGSWKKTKCTFQPFLLQQGSTAQLTSSNTSRDLQTATLLLMLLDAFLGTSHQTLSSSNQIGSGTSQKAHSSLACFTHSYYTYTV